MILKPNNYRSGARYEKIFGGVGFAVVIFFMFLNCNALIQAIDRIYETKAYEAIEIFNGKTFNELKDEEGFHQEIKVFPSVKYPGDKQVVIFNRKDKAEIILFIENDNGKAKVVDVIVDGKQVIFK
ncbi:MAG: hypothetical protein ACRC76_11525 [Proteocatella sp.]